MAKVARFIASRFRKIGNVDKLTQFGRIVVMLALANSEELHFSTSSNQGSDSVQLTFILKEVPHCDGGQW